MSLLQRRMMMADADGSSGYLFTMINPVFDEAGTYILTPVDPPASSPNLWITSGSATYTNQGAFSAGTIVVLTIDSTYITWTNEFGTFSQQFAGFPVQFGRPYATITYSVSRG